MVSFTPEKEPPAATEWELAGHQSQGLDAVE
jgi:hypothetical protein